MTLRPREKQLSADLAGYGTIWLVAFALRAGYLWELRNADVFNLLIGDAVNYDVWAREIAAGNWFGNRVFYQAPLYPYFLGILHGFFGDSLLAIRLVQIFFGATSCVLLARAGRSFFSPAVGLIAGALLALYPVAIFYDATIQKSVLDVFFVCALLAALGLLYEKATGRRWLLAGVLLGWLTLTRENALILFPVLLVWLFTGWRAEQRATRFRWAGLLVLGLSAALLPAAWHNFRLSGEFHVTTSQFGPNFYIGNNRDATGLYSPLLWGRGNARFEQEDAIALAEHDLGRKLSPGEVSHYWTTKALRDIQSDPARWLRLLWRKWLLVWNVSEAGDTDDPRSYAEWSFLLRMLFVPLHFGTLVPLAILGAFVTWPQRRKLWVLYLITAAYAFSLVLFYVFSRYRHPMVPLLLLFAAGGLASLRSAFQTRPAWRPLAGFAAAVMAAVFCNRPMIAERENRAFTHYNIAVNLVAQRRDFDGAMWHYAEAARLKPDLAVAHHNLAVLLARQNRTEEAIPEYREALRLHPNYPEAENNLAGALATQGDLNEAVTHLVQALKLNPRYAEAHCNLAVLLKRQGNLPEAMDHAEKALELDPGSGRFRAVLEGLRDLQQKPQAH